MWLTRQDLRRPDTFEERVELAMREMDEQRRQYRLYRAQRFSSGPDAEKKTS